MPISTPPSSSNWSANTLSSASASQAAWLERPGALTAGLRQIGPVALRVVREFPAALSLDEAWMLERRPGAPIWVREIVMAINGIDAVFARSFTPLAASEDVWQGMRRLQTRPLADMLYNDPQITRSAFYRCRLQAQQPIYLSARHALGASCPAAPDMLARCSVFWRQDEPLLVAECFLPAFWPMAGADKGNGDPA